MLKKLLLLLLFLLPVTALAADKNGESRSGSASEPSILILGDSLSTAYGISVKRGWVTLLDQRLVRAGYNYRIVNASVSGDTTHGALNRLDDLLSRRQPEIAVVELGGNDGLRGIQPAVMKGNLAAIIEQLQGEGAHVVLAPMRMPPNYGPTFTKKFESVYADLAEQYDIVLSRFILEDIALRPGLMQSDGIHPTAEAQAIMLDNVWPAIEQVLPAPPAQAGRL